MSVDFQRSLSNSLSRPVVAGAAGCRSQSEQYRADSSSMKYRQAPALSAVASIKLGSNSEEQGSLYLTLGATLE
jgi:hypothetical protein